MTKRRLASAASAVFVVFLVTSTDASAQETDHDRAVRHFEAGRAYVKSGRCDLAIGELTKSIDYEPASVGARLNIGDCLVTLDRLPEAHAFYKEAEARAAESHDARLDEARRSAAAVEAKLVRVLVREPVASAAGVTLSVDGGAPRSSPWSIVVTPDVAHTLDAVAPDGRRWSARVRAPAGEVVRLEVVLDGRRVDAAVAEPTMAPASPSGLRTAGVIVGASGAVALVAGGVFAILAASFRSDLADAVGSDPRCRGTYPNASCDTAARSSLDPIERRAFVSSTLATVSLVAGAALLAGGIVLFLASPSPNAPRVRVGSGAFLEGRF